MADRVMHSSPANDRRGVPPGALSPATMTLAPTIGGSAVAAPVPLPALPPPACGQDERSDNNVMATVGPPMWKTLHYAAHQCPEPFARHAQPLVDLVRIYAQVMPCTDCRSHFSQFLALHPPEAAAAAGREAFARYTVDAHNYVNARLGKPLMPYAEAQRIYGRVDLRCPEAPRSDAVPANPSGDATPTAGSPLLVGLLVAGLVAAVALVAFALSLHRRCEA